MVQFRGVPTVDTAAIGSYIITTVWCLLGHRLRSGDIGFAKSLANLDFRVGGRVAIILPK